MSTGLFSLLVDVTTSHNVLVAISGAGTETGKGVASDESTTPRGLVSFMRRHSRASMVPPVL